MVVPSTANYCCKGAAYRKRGIFSCVTYRPLGNNSFFVSIRRCAALGSFRRAGPSTARGNEAEQDLEKEAGSPRPRSLAQRFSLRDVTHNCCAGAFYLRFGACASEQGWRCPTSPECREDAYWGVSYSCVERVAAFRRVDLFYRFEREEGVGIMLFCVGMSCR